MNGPNRKRQEEQRVVVGCEAALRYSLHWPSAGGRAARPRLLHWVLEPAMFRDRKSVV